MFSRLKLAPKFTIALLLVFVLGSSISGFILSKALQYRAERQITAQGVVLMESMQAVRRYTDQKIRPLLENELGADVFRAELIPAYSASQVFELLRDEGNLQALNYFEDGSDVGVTYKQAVLNPTNLNDLADDFEAALTNDFINSPNTQELSGFRQRPEQGLMFYSALPIRIQNASCLECHSRPEQAPPAMIAEYGDQHGFGWKLNETVGVQVVYVPAEEVFRDTRQAFVLVMGAVFGVFAIALLCLNKLLNPLVLRPIQHLARISQSLAQNDLESSQDLTLIADQKLSPLVKRGDELGQLGRIFQEMLNDVITRQQWLREQIRALQSEVDETEQLQAFNTAVGGGSLASIRQRVSSVRKRRHNLERLMLRSRLVRQKSDS
ncbi:MAG: DUF3365 domain-containing protein [Cyanobacteria bacterium P01_H01_bin.58]